MEGQRVAKTPGGAKKGWIIAGVLAAVLAAAYLGLCIWVGVSGKILPDVTIAGLDVSNLTKAQAQTLLESSMERQGGGIRVKLHYGDWSETLTGADCTLNGYVSVERAAQVGRDSFLLQGFGYIRHLLGGSEDVELTVAVAPQKRDALLAEAERDVARDVIRTEHRVENDRLWMTKGTTGIAIDGAQTELLLNRSLAEAFGQAFRGGEGVCTAELPVQKTAPAEPEISGLWRELYTEAKNAEVDPVTYAVTDHVVGVNFDERVLRAEYDAAEEGETFSIPLTITQPTETRESLEAKLFADLLGEATSNVSGTSNRKFNVKLAAQACNGVVLMPGEEFSYNNTTGSRSADKGYLPAGVYVGGVSMDEVGGGICQVSSTIYYAVLRTTLEVVERHDHVYAVGYVPDGMDATVYYGSLDFRFKNNTNYPIKVVTESYDKDGKRKLTVKLYGTNEDGRYAVPERIQSDWVEPTTSYLADETVPQGTLVLDTKQNAYTGRKAQTYRHIYEADGTLVETQDMGKSTYKMRPYLYRYNPLDGDPATWVDGKPPVPNAQPDPLTPIPEVGEAAGEATGETTGEAVQPVPVDPADPEGPAADPPEAEEQPAAA